MGTNWLAVAAGWRQITPEWADLLVSCFGLTVIGRILRGCGLLRPARGVVRSGRYTANVPPLMPVLGDEYGTLSSTLLVASGWHEMAQRY